MIIDEIKRGLGNQLFPYDYGRALAEREGAYWVLTRQRDEPGVAHTDVVLAACR